MVLGQVLDAHFGVEELLVGLLPHDPDGDLFGASRPVAAGGRALVVGLQPVSVFTERLLRSDLDLLDVTLGDLTDELVERHDSRLFLASDEIEDHDAHQNHEDPEEQCFLALFHRLKQAARSILWASIGPLPLQSL